jgi:ABC-type transport system involved in cytochrome c biogenesis permease component
LAGLLLAPVDRGIIFAAKLLSNLILMFALAAVVTPVAILLFGFNLSAAPGAFVLITCLGMIGFGAVGTLFATVTSVSRLQGGLLALVVFPICLPLVIVSTQMLVGIFKDGRPLSGQGLGILLAFDAVFLVVSWLTFERVIES